MIVMNCYGIKSVSVIYLIFLILLFHWSCVSVHACSDLARFILMVILPTTNLDEKDSQLLEISVKGTEGKHSALR